MSSPDNTAKNQKLLLLDLSKSIKPNKAVGPAKTETIQINPTHHNFFNGKISNGGGGVGGPGSSIIARNVTTNGHFPQHQYRQHHHHQNQVTRPNGLTGCVSIMGASSGHHTLAPRGGPTEPIVLKPNTFPLSNAFFTKKISPSSSLSSCSSAVSSSYCSSDSSYPTNSSCNSSCISSSKASSISSGTSATSVSGSARGSTSSMTTRSSKLSYGTNFSSSASTISLHNLNDSSNSNEDSFTLSNIGSSSNDSSSCSRSSVSSVSIISDSNDEDTGTAFRTTRSSLGKSITNKRKSDVEERRRSTGLLISRGPLHAKTNLTNHHQMDVDHDIDELPKKKPRSETSRPSTHIERQNSIEVICLDDDDDDDVPPIVKPTPKTKSPMKPIQTQQQQQSNVEEASKRCLWAGCNFVVKRPSGNVRADFDPASQLVDHVKTIHVLPQMPKPSQRMAPRQYRCMWKNCKIYGQTAVSNGWLERHVVEHVEKCPFPCLLNGCKRKFRTEFLREKHIQNHMNTSENHNTSFSNSPSPVKTRKAIKTTRSTDLKRNAVETQSSVISKNLRKQPATTNGATAQSTSTAATAVEKKTKEKKTKRRNNANAETAPRKFIRTNFDDYVDACTMRVIEKRLVDLDFQSGTVTFTPKVRGIETKDNTTRYLIEWQPPNIIKTEWLERHQITETKIVSLAELRTLAVKDSTNVFYRSHRFRPNRRK